MQKLTGKDLLLLLLYVPGATKKNNEPIRGRTRIIKMMYIFKKELVNRFNKSRFKVNVNELPDFFAYKYGPFSKDVYNDIEFFKNIEFIQYDSEVLEATPEEAEELRSWQEEEIIDDTLNIKDENNSQEVFCLTNMGKRFVEEELFSHLDLAQSELLQEFKSKANSIPLRLLIRYVYERYPEDANQSTISKKILGG